MCIVPGIRLYIGQIVVQALTACVSVIPLIPPIHTTSQLWHRAYSTGTIRTGAAFTPHMTVNSAPFQAYVSTFKCQIHSAPLRFHSCPIASMSTAPSYHIDGRHPLCHNPNFLVNAYRSSRQVSSSSSSLSQCCL